MNKTSRSAFVAMKFWDDHWNDPHYQAIKDVLSEANYDCIRSDQIRTSGPVVDEVCRLLKQSDLVVIDSSGNSQSVAYEIGYCHGIGRSAESVLLIRNNAKMPFNYRHYRQRVYRDRRHLRRLLRDYLALSEPVPNGQVGYSFVFEFPEGDFGYIYRGAKIVFDSLREMKFSGRCECFSGEYFVIPGRRAFGVGIFLRSVKRPFWPIYKYWTELAEKVAIWTKKTNLFFDEQNSELGLKSAVLANLIGCGTAEFAEGKVINVLGPAVEEGNFFDEYLAPSPPKPSNKARGSAT